MFVFIKFYQVTNQHYYLRKFLWKSKEKYFYIFITCAEKLEKTFLSNRKQAWEAINSRYSCNISTNNITKHLFLHVLKLSLFGHCKITKKTLVFQVYTSHIFLKKEIDFSGLCQYLTTLIDRLCQSSVHSFFHKPLD